METIKSSAEISQLFSTGKRLKTPYLTLIVEEQSKGKPTGDDEQHGLHGRVAFIAGKKWGNAVWRNSSKRRLRELCRSLNGPWEGYDVLFVAKPSLLEASYSKVLSTCEKTLMKCFPDQRYMGK